MHPCPNAFAYTLDMDIDEEPATWEALLQQLAGAGREWLFRGQDNYSWKLATRLERDLARWPERGTDHARLAAEAEAMNTFVAKARHLLSNLPEDDYLGWLSVMQHYGAPTRLLDWTRSPFVACYFACSGNSSEDSAIWMLNEWTCRIAHGDSAPVSESDAGFKVFEGSSRQATISYSGLAWKRQIDLAYQAMMNRDQWPLVVIPAIADERIRAQQGVFTFHGDLSGLDTDCPTQKPWAIPEAAYRLRDPNVIAFLQGKPWGDLPMGVGEIVRKVRIKAAWKREIVPVLQQMNITPDTLFPGLDGIGRAATLQVQYGESFRGIREAEELRALFAEAWGRSPENAT